MAYELQEILRVRVLRERGARNELLKATNFVKECEEKLKKAEKKLEEYIEWRKKEEDRLYAEIMLKKVKREQITDLKQEIANLRDKENTLKDDIKKAEEAVEKAKEKLKQAKAVHIRSLVDLEKINQHKETWMEDFNKEEERKAESEFEEFQTTAQ